MPRVLMLSGSVRKDSLNSLLLRAVPALAPSVLKWEQFEGAKPTTKQELLAEWDAQTAQLDTEFPLIPVGRFSETMKAFGQWEMKGFQLLFYVLENEVHHRGQGYVYLRSLGIEPPAFYDREM